MWIVSIADNNSLFYRLNLDITKNYEIKNISIENLPIENLKIPEVLDNSISKVLKLKKIIKDYFNKNISYALEDIEILKENYSPLGSIVACSLKNYIKSNAALFDYSKLKKDLKKGEIKIKDIYEILEPDDNLFYVKIKGWDLHKLIDMAISKKITFCGITKVEGRGKDNKIFIGGKELKDEFLYRIIIPQSIVKNDYSFLSISTEFSVLPRTTLDAALWYFKTHRQISISKMKENIEVK